MSTKVCMYVLYQSSENENFLCNKITTVPHHPPPDLLGHEGGAGVPQISRNRRSRTVGGPGGGQVAGRACRRRSDAAATSRYV